MGFDTVWRELRERCSAIDSNTVLVTPDSGRAFAVDVIEEDRIVVHYRASDDDRTLWRDQFEVLYDRLETDGTGLSIDQLPAGVEPYVSVLSLASRYTVDESAATLQRDGEGSESPFLRPAWMARTAPQRVHDDAILLADILEEHDAEDLESLSTETMVDMYVLLSDVQRGADGLRKEFGDQLLEYIGPDANLHSRFGTVHRTTRERRRLKDEEVILDALDSKGIPHSWVLGVDLEKLDVVLAATDLEEDDVYNIHEQVYVQKTAVEEEEKQARLQGLRDRLAGLETEEAEELREDISQLEDRIATVLAAG